MSSEGIILVTGANGHVGFTICKQLVEQGKQIRATVRDANNIEKTKYLNELGVEIVSLDIRDLELFKKAAENVESVIHTAAVYAYKTKNPQTEIIEPALEGTRNLFAAAIESGVKTIIYTSSVVAVGRISNGKLLDENDWNESQVPYSVAKIESERLARELAQESNIKFITINPGAILGENFHKHTPSTSILERVYRGKQVILNSSLQYVDVENVAKAHIDALSYTGTESRFIVTGDDQLTYENFYDIVNKMYPEKKRKPMKAGFTTAKMLVGIQNFFTRLFGGTPEFSVQLIKEMGEGSPHFSNERAKKELGYVPTESTELIRKTIEWMKTNDLV